MILIGGEVKKEDLPRSIATECVIEGTRGTLEIKLQTIAKISVCEKVLLHKDFKNISLYPDIAERTMYFRDLEGLLLLLDRELNDEEKKRYSDSVLKGEISNYIDSDGTPVTTFELEVEEPEPDQDNYGVLDIVIPEVPMFELNLEDVEDIENLEIPRIDEVLQNFEIREQIGKAKDEIEAKEVELKKLELENKEAKLKKEQAEIRNSGKKNSGFSRFIMTTICAQLDWLGDGLKIVLGSVVVTICGYVAYSLLSGKPIDLQAGVQLYESFKALAIKVASDIQSLK